MKNPKVSFYVDGKFKTSSSRLVYANSLLKDLTKLYGKAVKTETKDNQSKVYFKQA